MWNNSGGINHVRLWIHRQHLFVESISSLVLDFSWDFVDNEKNTEYHKIVLGVNMSLNSLANHLDE